MSEFVTLKLDQIKPSDCNPRKSFDEDALKQLAASITAKGVLLPIVVRPRTLWQICCGFAMRQKAIANADGSDYGLGKGQFERAGITFKDAKQYDQVIAALVKEKRAQKTLGLQRGVRGVQTGTRIVTAPTVQG